MTRSEAEASSYLYHFEISCFTGFLAEACYSAGYWPLASQLIGCQLRGAAEVSRRRRMYCQAGHPADRLSADSQRLTEEIELLVRRGFRETDTAG